MDAPVFDVFSRRAAEALHRRSVLGVLGGAVLAALSPFAVGAKKGGGKGGGKGKKKNGNGKKKGKGKKGPPCKRFGNECRVAAALQCVSLFGDTAAADDCEKAFATCCRLEDNCKRQAAQQCFQQTAQAQQQAAVDRCLDAAVECQNDVVQACELVTSDPIFLDNCIAARLPCCEFLELCKFAEAEACFESINEGG